MRSRLQTALLALVFMVLGAFLASLWLEIRHETPAAPAASGGVEVSPIRVEVLNGGGEGGMARRATEALRARGFDVVYYGNADEFVHDSSVAIARGATLEPAQRVADALGLPRVERDPDRGLYLDVTVILGTDWEGAPAANGEETAVGLWRARIERALRRLWPG